MREKTHLSASSINSPTDGNKQRRKEIAERGGKLNKKKQYLFLLFIASNVDEERKGLKEKPLSIKISFFLSGCFFFAFSSDETVDYQRQTKQTLVALWLAER